jgi:hypothetical protein
MDAFCRLNPILDSTNPNPERQLPGLLGWVREKQIETLAIDSYKSPIVDTFSNNNDNKR